MAGALGFEPRMAVPKTAALPLGYAPNYYSYNTKKKIYIVLDNMHQYFLYFFFNILDASKELFFDKKYATNTDPDPVILTNKTFGNLLSINFFKTDKFGYFLNA